MMDAFNVLSEQWISHLWAVSWQVSILFVIIWIVDQLSFRASSLFRYWLWLIVLVRLCIPVNLTLPGGLGHVIIENIGIGLPHLRSLMVKSDSADELGSQEISPFFDDDMTGNRATIEPVENAISNKVSDVAGIVWLVSVCFICAIILYRIIWINRRLRICLPVKRNDLCLLFQKLKEDFGLNHAIGLYYMDIDNVDVPAVIGVIHPRILLPRKIADEWSIADIEPVLLHELAHVKRHDHIVNLLQVIIQVVYFFHPIVWIANHHIRKLREQLSDDLALFRLGLGNKRYSMSILCVMENAVEEPALGFVGIGFLERKSLAGERIKRIMDTNYKNRTKMTFLSIIMVIIIGTAGFFFSCGQLLVKEKTPTFDSEMVIPPEIIIDNFMTDVEKEAIHKAIGGIAGEDHIDLHVNIATAKSKDLRPPEELNQALENVADAVKKYSYITVENYKNIPLESSELFKVPLLFISADEAFELTQEESENLGNYLRNGGFVFIDNGTPEIEFSEAEASLRQMLRDALKSDAKFLPIPKNHPIYHCYYDFDDGPPRGIIPKMDMKSPYLEGILIEDRLVALYSDRGYIYNWLEIGNNEPQIDFGVNLIIFAVLQKAGMLDRVSRLNTQLPVKVAVLNNGEYEVAGIHVIPFNLEEILEEELAKSKSKSIVIYPDSKITQKDLTFVMDIAVDLDVKGIAINQSSIKNELTLSNQDKQQTSKICPIVNSENAIKIIIAENSEFEVDDKTVASSDLLRELQQVMKENDGTSVIIHVTPRTRYKDTLFVMKVARNAGIEAIAVITEQES